jgi:hypothetical protein
MEHNAMTVCGPSIARAGFLAAALAACAGPGALAGYGDRFDPDQVSVVGPTGSTSNCIGDPRTPECALETLFACVVRRDPELCRRVGVKEPMIEPCFDPRILDIRYKIEKVRPLDEKNIPPYLKKKKREGEVYVDILYDLLLCRPFNLPCTTFSTEAAKTLKSSGQGWAVTDFPWEADQCGPDNDD